MASGQKKSKANDAESFCIPCLSLTQCAQQKVRKL